MVCRKALSFCCRSLLNPVPSPHTAPYASASPHTRPPVPICVHVGPHEHTSGNPAQANPLASASPTPARKFPTVHGRPRAPPPRTPPAPHSSRRLA
ncbi:hypothetical protein FIBSPDRAFT_201257 [Athelia psychrophila]|uniref:Uncharacterized protein n=1 Tax=Athelia psychrophila TaxID=1759441 RepID=A0A165ZLA1_9AGAM|nr:hypothetical protein FIBSPDRAFT_201257 [Fibularhizoctonia sp. CBS 109695]